MPESNDTLFEATATGLSSVTPGTVTLVDTLGDNNGDLDVDFFQVELSAGEQLTIDLDTFGLADDLSDSILQVFDASGNLVTFSDDDPAPDETLSLDSYISFIATAAGTYYIGVSGFDNFFYDPFTPASGTSGAIGNYTLTMTLAPYVPPPPIVGTPAADSLTGTEQDDTISGLAGADRIVALGGHDQIDGGDDNDLISGGLGNDSIEGGRGDDQLLGEAGDDVIWGGCGSDLIIGDEEDNYDFGFDQLFGGNGNDSLLGGDADDWLEGNSGDDYLEGGFGFDTLEGGTGHDVLVGGPAFDQIDVLTGGLGRDTFMLGDPEQVFYDDGDPTSTGEWDYAVITDFNSLRDTIQLHGSATDYTVDYFDAWGVWSAAIVLDTDAGRSETIALLDNIAGPIDLSGSAFQYV